jgi:hypothetical protein
VVERIDPQPENGRFVGQIEALDERGVVTSGLARGLWSLRMSAKYYVTPSCLVTSFKSRAKEVPCNYRTAFDFICMPFVLSTDAAARGDFVEGGGES